MVFGQALADLGGEPPVLGEPRLYLSDQRALARGLGGRVALIGGRHGLSLAGADMGGNASRARSAPGGPVMIEAGAAGLRLRRRKRAMAQGRGTSKFARKVAIRRKVSVKLGPIAGRICRDGARCSTRLTPRSSTECLGLSWAVLGRTAPRERIDMRCAALTNVVPSTPSAK